MKESEIETDTTCDRLGREQERASKQEREADRQRDKQMEWQRDSYISKSGRETVTTSPHICSECPSFSPNIATGYNYIITCCLKSSTSLHTEQYRLKLGENKNKQKIQKWSHKFKITLNRVHTRKRKIYGNLTFLTFTHFKKKKK